MVEFIDLKTEPEPTRVVSRFSLIISADSITGTAELSFPTIIPVIFLSMS